MDKDKITVPLNHQGAICPYKYILCGYHDYSGSSQTMSTTLNSKNYLIGNRITGSRMPQCLSNVSSGDILLLQHKRKVVAYGEAVSGLSALAPSDSNRPHYVYEIKVKQWIRYDGTNPNNGIRARDIMKNCVGAEPPRAIAKEVKPLFAQTFIDEIDSRQP